ncbi:MAG: hypothetical protein KGD64_06970 [Candidatus Heimdallarchaeota archaeon]|nr:hypothetical protein [Candidatus Heimdallarchaeota archaeon]
MPDIKDSEKIEIQQIAKNFVMQLWKVPFNIGLTTYAKTAEALYAQHHRWKFCLRCGHIDKKENLTEGKHTCSLEFKGFPIITETSWYKLKQFFLTTAYTTLLKDIGVYDHIQVVPIRPKQKEPEISKAETSETLES